MKCLETVCRTLKKLLLVKLDIDIKNYITNYYSPSTYVNFD